jgi:hypothetical protein
MVAKGRMSTNSGYRKLDRRKADAIRFIYQETKASYKKIGAFYSVSPRTVGAVKNKESWK